MGQVGIRELRQNASEVIRRVAAGETVDVTDRGRPVARIVPLRPAAAIDQLIAEGRVTATAEDLLEVEPIQPVSGQPSLSEILAGMRADDR